MSRLTNLYDDFIGWYHVTLAGFVEEWKFRLFGVL